MSFTFGTKAELKSSIQEVLERDDSALTNILNGAIKLAEADMMLKVPSLNEGWSTTTRTGTIGSRELTLPNGFIEPLWLKLTTFGEAEVVPADTDKDMVYYASNGTPGAWCIAGDHIDLDTPCDRAHTFQFRYRGKITLSGEDDSNWILENYPNAYLYGTLMQCCIILRDPEGAAAWGALFNAFLPEVAWLESRSQSKALAKFDPALAGTYRYNIVTDT